VLVLDAFAARFGGTASFAVQLTRELLEREDVARLVVLAESDSVVVRELRPGPRLKIIRLPVPGPGRLVWRAAWETVRLPGLLAAEGADALLTFSGMVPRHPRCRVISLVSNPGPYKPPWTFWNHVRRRLIARTTRRADQLYVPSRAFAEMMGEPGAKIVPHGVDRDLFQPSAEPGADVLAVGDFHRHKRYDLIISAWTRLPEPRPSLRLIGNPDVDPAHFDELTRMATDPRVTIGGPVRLEELVEAYHGARVLVVASGHETFSMPITEAMASGVPVVGRDHPILRETGGPAAVYVSGDDVGDWARTIERLLTDDAAHGEMRSAGLARAERFSWAAVADSVVADARS
jgi:glycosyltransferase involved in cell wall biosynthesis